MALNPESGAVKLYANREEIESFVNFKGEKRLNEIDTFEFKAFITGDQDRTRLSEGNNIHVFDGNTLIFKGQLTEVNFTSAFEAECEGDGMAVKLLNRQTDRTEYADTAADQIVKSEVPDGDYVSYGTIDTAPDTSLRFDRDNKARAVAGAANAVGYDWRVRQEAADDYDTDFLDFKSRIGSPTSVYTLDIGDNAEFIDRQKDDGFLANDITLLGRGDGINQLEARVFAAADSFTNLDGPITDTESTSFTVDDTSVFGASGDNVIVRVGTEVFDCDISDSTTLNINSRGLDDYNGDPTEQIAHQDDVTVWLRENVTQSLGPYTPESKTSAETGSSIEINGVRQASPSDKTIVDKSTLEKVADRQLRNRFKDIFRIQVSPSEPRIEDQVSLGDNVTVKDVVSSDIDNTFRVIGIDQKRNSGGEQTVLHLANRPRRLVERLSEIEKDRDTLNTHMQGATNVDSQSRAGNLTNAAPLETDFYIPEDAVAVNKVEVVAKRRPYRVESAITSHEHRLDGAQATAETNIKESGEHVTQDTSIIPEGVSAVEPFVSIPTPTTPTDGKFQGANITGVIRNESGSSKEYDVSITGSLTGTLGTATLSIPDEGANDFVVSADGVAEGEIITFSIEGSGTDDTLSSDTNSGPLSRIAIFVSSKSDHSHDMVGATGLTDSPTYGISEPISGADTDVELTVDGNVVNTFNDVSLGEQIGPVDVSDSLSDPVAGNYHVVKFETVSSPPEINLRVNTFSKFFTESKLD